jgi:hypothetical protein
LTGKIFLKLILGVFCLLLLALVTVDYFATQVAQNTYIQNLTQQLADKARMLALSCPTRPGWMTSTRGPWRGRPGAALRWCGRTARCW